jgi:hypothetical protein
VALIRLVWVPVLMEAVAAWFFAPFLLWSSLEIIIFRYKREFRSVQTHGKHIRMGSHKEKRWIPTSRTWGPTLVR